MHAWPGSLCGTNTICKLRHPPTKGSGIRGHTQKIHTVYKLELEKRHLLYRIEQDELERGRVRPEQNTQNTVHCTILVVEVDQAWLPVPFRFVPCCSVCLDVEVQQ